MKRTFTLGQVLTTLNRKRLCDVRDFYEVYKFLTQDKVFTHQLLRVARECEPVMQERFPELAAPPFDEITTDNWHEWLEDKVDKFGPTVELEPIPTHFHLPIDPTVGAECMVGKERVFVVPV